MCLCGKPANGLGIILCEVLVKRNFKKARKSALDTDTIEITVRHHTINNYIIQELSPLEVAFVASNM